MFSRSQEKLLRYLGRFPETLEKAWDVPRELSLPGLSEAMGVVRSGLNQPLGFLESKGFLTVRVAHVIGGGTRRRQVYHITQKGRTWLAEHPAETSADDETVIPSNEIIGRNQELAALKTTLLEENTVIIGGLSGIGKTTLVRSLMQQPPFSSRPLHWADVNELSDVKSILSDWFPDDLQRLSDRDALFERANYGDACFVLDDLHTLSTRHSEDVLALLSLLKANERTVVVIGRYPLSLDLDWAESRVTNLEPKDAMQMLGEHMNDDERLSISQALGGHPMALNLYQEGDPLPEAGTDIQSFVQETMLNPLGEDEVSTLDHLILNPSPLPVEDLPNSAMIGALDDHALLRWTVGHEEVEVQHLVRNVRRAMLDDEDLKLLHEAAIKHWNTFEQKPHYAVLSLYHQMALDRENMMASMEDQFERLITTQDGAMAVIFNRAIEQRPGDEQLHYWAGKIALHRSENDRVKVHAKAVESLPLRNDLLYQLALLEGDEAEAKRLLEAQLAQGSEAGSTRLLLSAAVQHLDDRVFDHLQSTTSSDIESLLARIKLPEDARLRSPMTVSITMIQHGLALLAGNQQQASELVEVLESLSSPHDPLLLHLNFKTYLAFNPDATFDDLNERAQRAMEAQPSPFHRAIIGLALAERFFPRSTDEARACFDTLLHPDSLLVTGATAHRYAARWWYLRGQLYLEEARMAMRESAHRFRQAGCHNAARAVAQRLHRLL